MKRVLTQTQKELIGKYINTLNIIDKITGENDQGSRDDNDPEEDKKEDQYSVYEDAKTYGPVKDDLRSITLKMAQPTT